MYSVSVCTTSDRELPPPEFGAEVTWDRLTETLAREVGPDAAQLLAEPVHDPARDETHWHVTAESDPVRLSALGPAERDNLVRRLAALRKEVAARAHAVASRGGEANVRLAEAMQSATNVPDEESHVWSVAGRPVLSAWGRRPSSAARPEATITRSAPAQEVRPPPVPAPTIATKPMTVVQAERAAQAAAGAAGSSPREPVRFDWRVPLLWTLFLLILATVYYMLLPACAIHIQGLRFFPDRCQTAQTRELEALGERNEVLRDAIRKTELNLTQVCADPRLPSQSAPDIRDTERRVTEAHGARGKFDITLAWNGHADLDLHVYCPAGQISFEARNACGGALDIDRNASVPYTDAPVEHVTWVGDPPPGRYRIEVRYYDRRDATAGPVPFTVVVREDDSERAFHGTVEQPGEKTVVTELQKQ